MRDTEPVAKRIDFVGSIKWRQTRRFDRSDALDLAARRADVPGAGPDTRLVGVSSQGFDDDVPLDARILPEDLLSTWRR